MVKPTEYKLRETIKKKELKDTKISQIKSY